MFQSIYELLLKVNIEVDLPHGWSEHHICIFFFIQTRFQAIIDTPKNA